jgi:hypothetical protein
MSIKVTCAVKGCIRNAVSDMEITVTIAPVGAQTVEFAVCSHHGGVE